ncbi:hypothetical protein PILCRDRAFT_822073 [Piloderma croceum F 1598]|uniref:Uncharacterized protein n=1 Tax=Piloderma croceum (strain F 1598) TaxID=765440 RepID=A0A0C3F808_PILCF|nr:hypothetical protein PILCRDRAFT_822073 [Piloderma croceum F 1598]
MSFDNFDPLATHPFTNTSGLAPQPLQPSKYPYPISTPPHNVNSKSDASTSPPSSPPIHSPRPRRGSPSKPSSGQTKPIFVPFRQDRSSPDLGDILSKKKSPSSFDSKLSSSPGS